MPKDRPLTKREQNLINYHRSMLKSGKYLTNDDRSITTFRGQRFDTPDGDTSNEKYPYARVGLAPTYVNGQVLDTRTPKGQQLFNKNLSRIEYPTYKTDVEGDMAEERLHGIMEDDIKRFEQARRPKMSKLMGIKK